MSLHIVKLCVGAETIGDLADWQAGQIRSFGRPVCGTRSWPKRRSEILAGGSLYWVMRGMIVVRQAVVDIAPVCDEHGERCGFYLDPHLIRTAPSPRRAFQGWRYLAPGEAPPDLPQPAPDLPQPAPGGEELPEALRLALAALGAW